MNNQFHLTSQTITSLIRSVYDSTYIKHVVADGKIYKRFDNQWNNREDVDKTKKCKSYWNCDLEEPASLDAHCEYKIHIDHEPNIDDEECDTKIIEKFFQNISKLIFPSKYKVTLKNLSGINHGHRGSDHMPIELDYHDSFVLENNRFDTFIDGCYRIKSHKFDTHYELFCEACINKKQNEITISFDFDHGS